VAAGVGGLEASLRLCFGTIDGSHELQYGLDRVVVAHLGIDHGIEELTVRPLLAKIVLYELPTLLVNRIDELDRLVLLADALEHSAEAQLARRVQKDREGVGSLAQEVGRSAADDDARLSLGGVHEHLIDEPDEPIGIEYGEIGRGKIAIEGAPPQNVDQSVQPRVDALFAATADLHWDACEAGDLLRQGVIEESPIQARREPLANRGAAGAKLAIYEQDLSHENLLRFLPSCGHCSARSAVDHRGLWYPALALESPAPRLSRCGLARMSPSSRQALFSGTEAPSEQLRLDVAALGPYLASTLEGLGEDFSVEKFRGGQSNPTYKLTGARTYVLRRRPPGPLVPSAHAIDREYRVIGALAGAGFPVPHPYLYCDDESVIGSSFYVVSYCPGRVFWNAELEGLAGVERSAIYADMNVRLAQLHSFDVDALGLGDFGPRSGYVTRNLARWSKVYRQSELVPIADMDWLLEQLPSLVPPDERLCLVHGDYGLYNLVVARDGPRIDAVLDWEMSTLGNPWVDLAHHLRAWWEPADPNGAATSLQGCDLAALGIPSLEEYVTAYCRRSGASEPPYWRFYLGFAQFRYAAMVQGILKRASIGTASSRTVLHRQERVAQIAALARATLTGAKSGSLVAAAAPVGPTPTASNHQPPRES